MVTLGGKCHRPAAGKQRKTDDDDDDDDDYHPAQYQAPARVWQAALPGITRTRTGIYCPDPFLRL